MLLRIIFAAPGAVGFSTGGAMFVAGCSKVVDWNAAAAGKFEAV
jgi:hypothetical protein